MEEKVQQFIGLNLVAVTYQNGVIVLSFDTDGDPNTENVTLLTISNVADGDIRCDPLNGTIRSKHSQDQPDSWRSVDALKV